MDESTADISPRPIIVIGRKNLMPLLVSRAVHCSKDKLMLEVDQAQATGLSSDLIPARLV